MNSLSFAIFPVFYAWSDEIELSTELAITPRARTFTTITPLALPSQIQQRVYNFSVRSVVTRQSSLYTCIKSALNVLYIYVGWFVCAHESFWFGRMKNVLFFQLLFLVHSANTYIYFNKKDVDGSTFWFDPFAVPSFACVFCVFFSHSLIRFVCHYFGVLIKKDVAISIFIQVVWVIHESPPIPIKSLTNKFFLKSSEIFRFKFDFIKVNSFWIFIDNFFLVLVFFSK